jgi:hypothetical protein
LVGATTWRLKLGYDGAVVGAKEKRTSLLTFKSTEERELIGTVANNSRNDRRCVDIGEKVERDRGALATRRAVEQTMVDRHGSSIQHCRIYPARRGGWRDSDLGEERAGGLDYSR